jgi:hypothetical protein
MAKDYRLYELSEAEFESLAVRICIHWLGNGVVPFAAGRDGGRDGKFSGTAKNFPNDVAPLSGDFVLQAKHVAAPNKSCSEADFARLLKKEHAKIKRLVRERICDHYVVFTNRKLTGGADENLIKNLKSLGLKSAHIIAVESLHLAIETLSDVRDWLPNLDEPQPFRFYPDDLVEIIAAIHAFTHEDSAPAFRSAVDFDAIKIKEEKNKLNGLSKDYYEQIVVAHSMPNFPKVESFLKNPRNRHFADLYHDSADELKSKILLTRDKFETFDAVFAFLVDELQRERAALKGKRRLATILLHYMYFNCDIGMKDATEMKTVADALA